MKSRNYYVYNPDLEVLKVLAEEYQSMGRDTKIEGNRLCVFARNIKPVKKKVDKKPKSDVESPERSREQRPKRKE